MARLRSPSLFHTVTEHPAMLFVAMFVRRVGCDGLYVLRLWLSRLCRRYRDDGAARLRAVWKV